MARQNEIRQQEAEIRHREHYMEMAHEKETAMFHKEAAAAGHKGSVSEGDGRTHLRIHTRTHGVVWRMAEVRDGWRRIVEGAEQAMRDSTPPPQGTMRGEEEEFGDVGVDFLYINRVDI